MKIKSQIGSGHHTAGTTRVEIGGTRAPANSRAWPVREKPAEVRTVHPRRCRMFVTLPVVILCALIMQVSPGARAQVVFTLLEDTRVIKTGPANTLFAGFGQPFNESLNDPYLYFGRNLA